MILEGKFFSKSVEFEQVTHCQKYHTPKPMPANIIPDMAPTLMSIVDGTQENKKQAGT